MSNNFNTRLLQTRRLVLRWTNAGLLGDLRTPEQLNMTTMMLNQSRLLLRENIMGYQGDTMLDTGTVYCPYIPLVRTQVFLPNDFTPRRGTLSRYGTINVNNDYYGTVNVGGVTKYKDTYIAKLFKELLQYLLSYLIRIKNNLNIADKETLIKLILFIKFKLYRDFVSGLYQKQIERYRPIEPKETPKCASESISLWSSLAMPLVRRVFGRMQATDFVTVQPMLMPTDQVFYLDDLVTRRAIPTANPIGVSVRYNENMEPVGADVVVQPLPSVEHVNIPFNIVRNLYEN